MTTKQRLIFGGFLLAIAAVMATMADVAATSGWKLLVYIFSVVALLLVFSAILVSLGRNYFPGGAKNIAVLLPICKAKIHSAWSVCTRCVAYPLGMIFSALFIALASNSNNVMRLLNETNPWILFACAFALNTPTAFHGSIRRLYNGHKSRSRMVTFFFGFLSGVGFTLGFYAFKGFGVLSDVQRLSLLTWSVSTIAFMAFGTAFAFIHPRPKDDIGISN